MAQEERTTPAWNGRWPQTLGEFEKFVEAFQDRLVRYAFRRTGNLHDAEDVAQDVLARAYLCRAERTNVSSVAAYLYGMAFNSCADRLRARPAAPVQQSEMSSLPSRRPGAAETAAALDEMRRIEALVDKLPQEQAEVVRLRFLDELHLKEIAELTSCPLATVKSRLRYGLEKLRDLVPQREEESR